MIKLNYLWCRVEKGNEQERRQPEHVVNQVDWLQPPVIKYFNPVW